LVWLLASESRRPSPIRRGLMGTLMVLGLRFVLVRFLDNAMSFDGWAAQVYAVWLALTFTLWGFSLVLPLLGQQGAISAETLPRRALTWAAIVGLGALAMASRSLIGGEDWNGFVQNTWALIFWIALSVCVYRLRPMRMNYSPPAVVAALLLSAAAYKGLQLTEIFWAKPLGSTDDEISLALEEYGGRDASFQLAHHVLGNSRYEKCGDLCRILREYTNIRDNRVTSGVRLVDELTPAQGERPNIFLFVIDSMRPDYLGAYNPRNVDYTPNLDALARDSVVFTNVYTQYAGTSLSEPAIWSGALLLHTHFPQPFAKVNSLQAMAHADGYQTVVSYDTVLRQLFPAADGLTTLDTDKNVWNQYEACSTVEQLESVLDARADKAKPVLFYAQPMNVHQFAKNGVPSLSSQHWHAPAGLSLRITYEVHWVDSCLGQFFAYLKQRGMYDNSVIVVTSDHGDATGEFGRTSHSTSIWPEIMRVPLIVHVPPKMRKHLAYDPGRISALIDITPTLYYLLGHRPIRPDPLYGRPLFAETKQELESYGKDDLLLASDVRAVYGILTADTRYLYVTYDSPPQSYLFDLMKDPHAEHNVVTPQLKRRYDEEIIEHLHLIADHYGYKPGVGSLLATARR
jgi:arylsulfatase A-like enzyme